MLEPLSQETLATSFAAADNGEELTKNAASREWNINGEKATILITLV